jgi:ATPase family associated with various cellular activities (AAA)
MPKSPSTQKRTANLIARPLSTSQSKIRVKAGDNWLLIGRKGSGKTTFGKKLLYNLSELYPTSRIYVLDVKRRDFGDYPGIIETDYQAPPSPNERIQVWQPLIEDPEQIERWLYGARQDAPAIIVIDELLALCYTSTETSQQFKIIQKLGRDLPIGTIVGTQEVVQIPRNAIGQADHFVRFRLKHPYEKSYMQRLLGEHDEPIDKYGFYYIHADDEGLPHYYTDLSTFF